MKRFKESAQGVNLHVGGSAGVDASVSAGAGAVELV